MDLPDNFILDIEEKLKALRDIRKDAGYTQQQLADLLGLKKSRICQIESGDWRKSEHMRTFVQLIRLIDNLQIENAMRDVEDDDA